MKIETGLTYSDIETRCKDAAKELAPDFPTTNTVEAWEAFASELEDFDTYAVHEYVKAWDWSIYTHFGWKILHLVGKSKINEAESQWCEYNQGIEVQDLEGGCFDIWSLQSSIAYFVLVSWVEEELQSLIIELQDLAETTLYNLEDF